jgi:hypothetical protein
MRMIVAKRHCRAAVGVHFYIADAASAYTAFAVDQRDQEKFTYWWPSGPRPEDPWVKKARTRMPFGWSGAAQVCVEYYNRMKASVPEWVRSARAAFFDDHAYVGATTFERFLEGLDIFLTACIDWGVWLAPRKTCIALRTRGLESTNSGDSASTATEELCSVIGICALSAR